MKTRLPWLLLAALLLFASGCDQRSGQADEPEAPEDRPAPSSVSSVMPSAKPEPSPAEMAVPSPPVQRKREGIVPVRIEIPAIQVDAAVEHVGLLENGQMDVPKDDVNVGWFEPGIKPGDAGNAAVAGHVDNKTGPSVFYHLKELKPGDRVFLSDAAGKKVEFEVKRVAAYDKDDAPIGEIFGREENANLNLITCAGVYNKKKRTHEERLVVYTTSVES